MTQLAKYKMECGENFQVYSAGPNIRFVAGSPSSPWVNVKVHQSVALRLADKLIDVLAGEREQVTFYLGIERKVVFRRRAKTVNVALYGFSPRLSMWVHASPLDWGMLLSNDKVLSLVDTIQRAQSS